MLDVLKIEITNYMYQGKKMINFFDLPYLCFAFLTCMSHVDVETKEVNFIKNSQRFQNRIFTAVVICRNDIKKIYYNTYMKHSHRTI